MMFFDNHYFPFSWFLLRDDIHVSVIAEFLVAIVTHVIRGSTYVANITLT